MSEPFTAPEHAVSVWLEGHEICVRFTDSHTIRLPADKHKSSNGVLMNVGCEILLNLMRDRAIAYERETARKIGTFAAPVQYDIEAIIRSFGGPITRPKSAAKDMTLEELGL